MDKTQQKQYIEKTFKRYPDYLVEVPKLEWETHSGERPQRVWQSCHFLVQQYHVSYKMIRLSINRTTIAKEFNKKTKSINWKENISWDELQKIKFQCGYGEKDAVEIFPKDKNIVCDSKLRHLFVYLQDNLDFAWRS